MRLVHFTICLIYSVKKNSLWLYENLSCVNITIVPMARVMIVNHYFSHYFEDGYLISKVCNRVIKIIPGDNSGGCNYLRVIDIIAEVSTAAGGCNMHMPRGNCPHFGGALG